MRQTALAFLVACYLSALVSAATQITFDASGVMSVNGQKKFVISFALPPPPDGKTPDGKDAFAELVDAGANYMRVPPPEKWDEQGLRQVQRYLDAAATHRMLCWITLRDLAQIKPGDSEKEQVLRRAIAHFEEHPANGGYKGSDEPAWGKVPVESVKNVYDLIKSVDADHPVLVLHAPKFTIDKLAPYMPFCDVTGADIFPIAFGGPGHSDLPNKDISVVGDETKKIMRAAGGKPVWMTLQIAFSGTVKPQRTLRMPTFPQERYMTYQAIINGARGINYFGGALPQTLSEADARLGWNWRFWNRVLRPIIEEIGEKSPLYPALLAPLESKLSVKLEGADDVEFCVREIGKDIFLLAAKREGETAQVTFSGLPLRGSSGDVLFESPRTVEVSDGSFKDWFGPNEVHVYRFTTEGK